MKKREYFIYISGEDLDSCLLHLESLDHRPHGHVVISAIGDNINITRRTKKESVSVEIRASGYWPFEMGFPWNRFKRLMLKNHASVIKISIPISANGEANLIADGMHISPDEVSEQLSLALVSDRPDWAKPAMSSEESYIVQDFRSGRLVGGNTRVS